MARAARKRPGFEGHGSPDRVRATAWSVPEASDRRAPRWAPCDVEATCMGPESPPMKSDARDTTTLSSSSDKSSHTMAAAAGPATSRRVCGDGLRSVGLGGPSCDDNASEWLRRGEPPSDLGKRVPRPAPERVARAHVKHDDLGVVWHARGAKARVHTRGRVWSGMHLRRVDRRVRWTDAERRQQVPLVLHRMPRWHKRRVPWHPGGVRPASARDVVADARRRPGCANQPRTAGAAMEVDRHVEIARRAGGGRPPHRRRRGADPEGGPVRGPH